MEFRPISDDKLMSNGMRNLSRTPLTFPQRTEESDLLIKKVKTDLMQKGSTEVICPKCGSKIAIIYNTAERFAVSCECCYIREYEIYL
jgi:hypothetical protein